LTLNIRNGQLDADLTAWFYTGKIRNGYVTDENGNKSENLQEVDYDFLIDWGDGSEINHYYKQ
jgi:hypothetical protein